ncbi:hypothetical protein BJ875DRAFT_375969 [Amylocarpus encephaloides]|uniref:N-alpha-acetyltransferase 40 n=1 Tax=Amylocarpus encephaloides TaxID=45428 RepID=A0A9P8C5X2_9HELO|nr:hypothetical protein BJ875DRAFT_375969 [Amylocarpus encephaloides]
MDPIDLANSKTLTQFAQEYLPPSKEWTAWTHPQTHAEFELVLQAPKQLAIADFDACFDLIELTSSQDYKNSKDGWKPRSKRKEMNLDDLKYILIKSAQGSVDGFLSFMPTYEDGYPVIYCYEIHLSPALQGTGLGTSLMQMLDFVAAKVPGTAKIMLTCFTCNERGMKFYDHLGYSKDEYSPLPKMLRNGTKVEEEYAILSKVLMDLSRYQNTGQSLPPSSYHQ